MNPATIIKQLEKALECKDDKELRLRVEVLLDVVKEEEESRPRGFTMPETRPVYPLNNKPADNYLSSNTGQKITGKKGNQVRGAGSITSVDSEQINYSRPAGT